jgi:hypothetical protein
MLLTVRGKRNEWAFEINADEKYLKLWQADGLDIDIVENSCPGWVLDIGLYPVWFFFQDIFRK